MARWCRDSVGLRLSRYGRVAFFLPSGLVVTVVHPDLSVFSLIDVYRCASWRFFTGLSLWGLSCVALLLWEGRLFLHSGVTLSATSPGTKPSWSVSAPTTYSTADRPEVCNPVRRVISDQRELLAHLQGHNRAVVRYASILPCLTTQRPLDFNRPATTVNARNSHFLVPLPNLWTRQRMNAEYCEQDGVHLNSAGRAYVMEALCSIPWVTSCAFGL